MSALPENALGVVGGKARVLLELQLAGFPVPDFICDPPDAVAAVAELGLPLAVRSSATVEDGGQTSFAGQFRSFLNLRSVAEVGNAIAQCYDSVRQPSVSEYCRRQGIDPASVRMGVIVQRMVQPDLAGVVFTVNPTTGEEEVVIEAVAGLADNLLAGRERPLPQSHSLLGQYRSKIERTARRIHRHFGAPQDIEFAVENGRLHILQARPITRIGFAAEIGEWTNADFRDGGVSCGVCTPLMWSLYDFIWERALKGFLGELKLLREDFPAARMFFGRPYWNLGAVKRCLARLPGFVERNFDRDLGVEINYAGNGIETPVTLGGIIRAIPTARALSRIWSEQERFDRWFLQRGFAELTAGFAIPNPSSRLPSPISSGAISERAEEQLHDLIARGYWMTEANYFRTIYCASLAKLDFMETFPQADYPALTAGLPELAHLEPTRVLRQMAARGETDVTSLLQRFAHRSRQELDIRVPRWDEDRPWVERLLQEHAVNAERDPKPAYEHARAEARRQLRWHQRRKFDRKLNRLRTFLWLREEMRDLSSRMYHLIRRHVVAIAARRGVGDDIFFMSFEEILRDDRSNVELNRSTYESYRLFKAPNEIGSRFVMDTQPATGALCGIGASAGVVQGTARVAHNIEQALAVERGSILVCPFTDPGWTPVLDRVAGVVTETGGLLSHAAVICREYGIPAVLAVKEATTKIQSGTRVRVDGTSGQVEVVG